MSLIDDTYFIGEITIAQLSEQSVADNLQIFIDKYEPLFLQEALGYGFAKLMLDNPTEQRFVDLISGSEYTYNNVLRMWYGLANTDKMYCPIAQYIFYKYVRSQFEQQVGIGTMIPKAENATVVAPTYTLIKAWNDMVGYLHNMHCYLKSNEDIYPEYKANEAKCFETINHYF